MFSYECIPPNSQGRPMQGMIIVLPGNYHQLLRSPFHSQRSYKIKKTYSNLRFYQGDVKEERNASPITLSDLHAMLGRNHTNRLQID
jgi:hypothetical protein